MIFGLGSPIMSQSDKLGEVERIMFDPNTHRVEYLVVRHGTLLTGTRVVPFHNVASIDDVGLHLGIDADAFGNLPAYTGELDRARDPDYIAPPAEEAAGRSGIGFQMDSVTAHGSLGFMTDKPMGYPGHEQTVPDDRQLPVVGRGTDVFDELGEKVGEIGHIAVESETGMPARITVRRGFIFKDDLDIPLAWLDGFTTRGIGLNIPKSELESYAETRAA